MKTGYPSTKYPFFGRDSIFSRGKRNPAAGITETRETPIKCQLSLYLKWLNTLFTEQNLVFLSIGFQRLFEKLSIRRMAPNYLPAIFGVSPGFSVNISYATTKHSSPGSNKNLLFVPEQRDCFKIIR